MQNNYFFDQSSGSFFMNDYETGKKWENHIWNHNQFITTVDQFGNSKAKLVTENAENVYVDDLLDTATLYIRDDQTLDYWNIGYAPSFQEIKEYTCEHGLTFTKVSSSRNGIWTSKTISVCENENAEIWKITLKNNSKKEKSLSIFAFCKFNLSGLVQSNYYYPGNSSQTIFVDEANALLCSHKNPFMTKDAFSGYIMASEKVNAFCGRFEHFTGTAGNTTKPYILQKGLDLDRSNASARDRSGILQNKIVLPPDSEYTLYYALGFTSSNPSSLFTIKEKIMLNPEQYFECLYEKGIEQFGALRTVTPEIRINNIMNFWVQKQVSYCAIGKKAVRDNAQIALAMLNYNVPLAKKILTECIENQYYDGHALLTWSPFSREKEIYSDPSAWLIIGICEYIKESGDIHFLEEEIAFLDNPTGTVYDHLVCAAEWFMREDNYGVNQLPLIHHADWNDALNIPDPNAESVFMAMLICYSFKELIALFEHINGSNNYITKLRYFYNNLATITNEKAYNGEYYVRAFSKFGVVGDKTSLIGGNIYVNPQIWAILSEIIPEDRINSILSAIDTLETEEGIPLCHPPYQRYDESIGRMSAMPPGIYENGGIYNHACAFKVMADCKLGRSEHAVSTLLKMIPDGKNNPSERTTTEPYVFTNCYLKNTNEDMVVGFSWQTGSSAWALKDYYEGILGIERSYEGLKFKPNIPVSWDKVTVNRSYRGNLLKITYINKGQGTPILFIDGKKEDKNIVAPFNDNEQHDILITL